MMAQVVGVTGSSNELKARLSKALFELNLKLASCQSGALVQVWMPEVSADGGVVLSAQGLPFAIAGVGDLLALFRCVSCRYRFSTDVMRPSLMGAIGRVYSSCEPEMSNNVQKYDKQVYLRVSEAQRCRVHSTLVMPLFGSASAGPQDRPVAVFELVQADKDVAFPAVISELRKCLNDVALSTADPAIAAASASLRGWPLNVDSRPSLMHELLGDDTLRPAASASNSSGRLLLENDGPADVDDSLTGPARLVAAAQEVANGMAVGPGQLGTAVAAATGQTCPASSFVSVWAEPSGTAAATWQEAAVESAALPAKQAAVGKQYSTDALAGRAPVQFAAGPAETAAAFGVWHADAQGIRGPEAAAPASYAEECADAGVMTAMTHASQGAASKVVPAVASDDLDAVQSKQHFTPAAQGQVDQEQQQHQQSSSHRQGHDSAVLTTQMLTALTTAATSIQQQAQQVHPQHQQQQQQVLDLSALVVNSMQALLTQHPQVAQVQQQQHQQQQPQSQQQQHAQAEQQSQSSMPGLPDPAALSSAISTLVAAASARAAAGSAGDAAASQPLLAAVQQLQALQQQLSCSQGNGLQQQSQQDCGLSQGQTHAMRNVQPAQQQAPALQQQPQAGTMKRNASNASMVRGASATHDQGDEGDEFSGSDGEDDAEAAGRSQRQSAMHSIGSGGHGNRHMGAGRKLTFEDLQAQFGLGLKEAAANLGICATTLKRACRRNGITRWPRRQIQKLNRTLHQMGPHQAHAAPLEELVQSAVRKNLKPDVLTPAVAASLQQQLLQQVGAATAPDGACRSASMAVPQRVTSTHPGSAGSSYNEALGSLAGSVGEHDAANALGTRVGSSAAPGQFLPGFGPLSHHMAAGSGSNIGGLSASLGCDDAQLQQLHQLQALQQQQVLLQQQLAQHQETAYLPVHVGGSISSGNLQAMHTGILPQQHNMQQQHLAIMQTQALLNQNMHLQQLVAQQQEKQQPVHQQHLDSLPQLGCQGMQMQQSMLSAGMVFPPAFNTLAGGPGLNSANNTAAFRPPASIGLPAQQLQQHSQMQQQRAFDALARHPGLAAPAGGGSGTAAGPHTTNQLPVAAPATSMAVPAVSLMNGAAAAASSSAECLADLNGNQQQEPQHDNLLGDLDTPGGEGFLDLLGEDMLLDDGSLDLSLSGFVSGSAATGLPSRDNSRAAV